MCDEQLFVDGTLIQAWSSHAPFHLLPPAPPDGTDGGLPGPAVAAQPAPDYELRCRTAVASTFSAILERTREGMRSLGAG